jgi:hypothetical protein
MILKVIINEQIYELMVPEALLSQASEFFHQMDRDMDQGWQMSREWVDRPNREQRCQIVADKLLTALENENDRLGRLMAGYLLSRLPGIESVEIDSSGEIQNTQFALREAIPQPAPESPTAPARPQGLDKVAALEQAGSEVTKVFKVGHAWRFSVFDQAAGQWRDAASVADKDEAERLRQEALRQRFEELAGTNHQDS